MLNKNEPLGKYTQEMCANLARLHKEAHSEATKRGIALAKYKNNRKGMDNQIQTLLKTYLAVEKAISELSKTSKDLIEFYKQQVTEETKNAKENN